MADISFTAANVDADANATTASGTAGATITAGQPLYQDSADSNQFKPAQADAASTDKVAGLALHGASDEQPITYITEGDLDLGGGLTKGTVYALSAAAAGGIAPVSDLTSSQFVTVLGVATSTTNLKVKIINSEVAI